MGKTHLGLILSEIFRRVISWTDGLFSKSFFFLTNGKVKGLVLSIVLLKSRSFSPVGLLTFRIVEKIDLLSFFCMFSFFFN